MMTKNSTKWIRIIFISLSILWMILIFILSSQNAELSSNTSGHLTKWVQKLFYPSWELKSLEDYQENMVCLSAILRKIAHGTEFAILGFTLAMIFTTVNITWLKKVLFPWIIGVVYACSDEFHQYFVPGRDMSGFDLLIDGVGVFIGIMITLGITAMIVLTRKNNENLI